MATSVNEQYIVDEEGNPTAVILPIKQYKKMLSILEDVEDHRETKILSLDTPRLAAGRFIT